MSISHCLSLRTPVPPRDALGMTCLLWVERHLTRAAAPLANLSAGRRYCYREEFFSWADGACTSKWRPRPPEVAATVYYPNCLQWRIRILSIPSNGLMISNGTTARLRVVELDAHSMLLHRHSRGEAPETRKR